MGNGGGRKHTCYSTQFYFSVNLIFSNNGFLLNNFFRIYFKRTTWTRVPQFKTVFNFGDIWLRVFKERFLNMYVVNTIFLFIYVGENPYLLLVHPFNLIYLQNLLRILEKNLRQWILSSNLFSFILTGIRDDIRSETL